MNREIKFRAWNKSTEEWVYFTLDELHGCNWDWKEFENWCQYTGLKDKQGKKIYTGDILKIKRKFWKKDKKPKWLKDNYVVEFWQYWGRYNLVHKRKDGMDVFGLSGSVGKNEDLEVIGNIFEKQTK